MKKNVEFRSASLAERQRYYEEEFNIDKVKEWFYSNGLKLPQLCAVDAGTETGIIIDKKFKGSLYYFPFRELKMKIKKYIPEDLYYDRNVYDNPGRVLRTLKFSDWKKQELVFDIDTNNLSDSKKVNDELISKAFLWAKKMKKNFEKEFRKIEIVYSGAGFHAHVLDEKAFNLNIEEREELNRKFSKYPIDPWVSQGNIYLIRMPYSLNGLISRIVFPLGKSIKFDKKKTYPKFLAS